MGRGADRRGVALRGVAADGQTRLVPSAARKGGGVGPGPKKRHYVWVYYPRGDATNSDDGLESRMAGVESSLREVKGQLADAVAPSKISPS